MSQPLLNLSHLPPELLPIFQQAVTCEYASLTQKGQPITFPCTPYVNSSGRTLDVSTGLTYPAKADRARRNPKVALLFSDPVGANIPNMPHVLVVGRAAVRDADLQANTDRYLRDSTRKMRGLGAPSFPPFLLGFLNYYFARIWVEITPERLYWWPNGNTDVPPQTWQADAGTVYPPSDPAPQGAAPSAWKEEPQDWRSGAQQAVSSMGIPVLTWVDADGSPLAARVKSVSLSAGGFTLDLPTGLPGTPDGLASLTFHVHDEKFSGQENMVFVGQIKGQQFTVERRLADWSLGTGLATIFNMLRVRGTLKKRLASEAARRGQPVPIIKRDLVK